jgi:hypothetical protein
MAVPLLSRLSLSARKAYPFIVRAVRQGLSLERIGKAFRAEGIALSNEVFRQLARAERSLQAASGELRFLRPGQRPSPTRLPEALTRILRRYAFFVEVMARDVSTGEQVLKNVTVSTSRLMTKRQIEVAAMEAVDMGLSTYGLEADTALLVGGMKSGEQGVL